MSWRAPDALWLLLSLPALLAFLVWAWRRRRRALEHFAEARLLPVLTEHVDERRSRWRGALLAVGVALLVVAVAGPRWGFHWEEVRREGVDIVVAIDTSRSMLAPDVKPNRLRRATLAVEDLVNKLRGDRIGLVAFAGTAFLQCPLTLDYEAFLQSLRAVEVGIIPRGGTALNRALRVGLEAFEGRQGKHAVLVVITDGEDHEGEVDAAALEAAAAGVKVYTVGIGTPSGELLPAPEGESGYLKDRRGQVVQSRLDEQTLRDLAATTGGAYVRASGSNLGLDELYDGYIGSIEKRKLESTMERRFEERFQWPLIGAILCVAMEALVGDRRRTGPKRRWRLFARWRRRT